MNGALGKLALALCGMALTAMGIAVTIQAFTDEEDLEEELVEEGE